MAAIKTGSIIFFTFRSVFRQIHQPSLAKSAASTQGELKQPITHVNTYCRNTSTASENKAFTLTDEEKRKLRDSVGIAGITKLPHPDKLIKMYTPKPLPRPPSLQEMVSNPGLLDLLKSNTKEWKDEFMTDVLLEPHDFKILILRHFAQTYKVPVPCNVYPTLKKVGDVVQFCNAALQPPAPRSGHLLNMEIPSNLILDKRMFNPDIITREKRILKLQKRVLRGISRKTPLRRRYFKVLKEQKEASVNSISD